MPSIELSSDKFRSICVQLGYRRKKVRVVATETVTLHDLNWSGGTRNEYCAVYLRDGKVKKAPMLGNPHPMENEYEGARIAMRPDILIISTGVFMGKPAMMTIFCHPDNFPYLIGE